MKKFFAGLIASLIFFASAQAYAPEGEVHITMLDIGQGDSFLVETHTQNILIDAGDYSERKKLLAELKRAGVSRFEKIILTHPHADHIGGITTVLKNFPVDIIFDNGFISSSPLYKKYHQAGVSCVAVKAGDVLDFDDATFTVLNPDENFTFNNINNQSVVGKLVFKDFTMLFTGDLEADAEEELIKRHDVKAWVLKAGHHGSKTSSSMPFLYEVFPSSIIVSCGRENRYKHPHMQALERMDFFTDDIYCTSFNGTVKIVTDGADYTITADDDCQWLDF